MVFYTAINNAGPRKPHCFSVLLIAGSPKTEFDWCSVRLVCSPIRQMTTHYSRIQNTRAKTPQYGRYVTLAQNMAHYNTTAFTTGTIIRRTERARAHTHTHTGQKKTM